MGLTHHELCFGCGSANLFGLQMEVEPGPTGGVAGRFFVKQDHGGGRGDAHPGVIAAALEEALSLALESEGLSGRPERLEVRSESAAPVGAFVHVEARLESREGDRLRLRAEASLGGADARPIASARAVFAEGEP